MQGLEVLPLPLELMSVVALHGVGVGYDLRVDPLNFCHLWGYELVRSIIIMTHNRVGVNIIMSRTTLELAPTPALGLKLMTLTL